MACVDCGKKLAKWYVAGWDHVVHSAEAQVRVGGTYPISFGVPPGAAVETLAVHLAREMEGQ